MIRFTLKDNVKDFSIRMEMPEDEPITELHETVRDYWGESEIVLVRDYMILDPGLTIGEAIRDGDVVEAMPDPRLVATEAL
jgi:hypothetical protein